MKKLLVTLALGASSFSAFAITPLWLRDVNISPDGKEIVFCYKGDIYKVKAAGGEAVRLTSQDSYESNPVWSPDGKQIAFASDRFGNFDLFIMPADGGTAKRLTMNQLLKYRRLLLLTENTLCSRLLFRTRLRVRFSRNRE